MSPYTDWQTPKQSPLIISAVTEVKKTKQQQNFISHRHQQYVFFFYFHTFLTFHQVIQYITVFVLENKKVKADQLVTAVTVACMSSSSLH